MPDQPQQSSAGTTKRVGLSVEEATARFTAARKSAAAEAAAPTSEQEPAGLDPEVTNPETGESDAGGSVGDPDPAPAGEGEDGDPDAKDPVFVATINGEEVEVPLSALIASYQRHGDYTRKTQELAEQRRAVESKAKEVDTIHATLTAEQRRVAQEREQYDVALQALQGVLKTADDEWSKIDWDQLDQDDPVEAQRQWRRYQQHKERKAEAEAEAKRRDKERADEAARAEQEAARAFSTDVAKHFPQWSDAGVRTKEWGEMYRTAQSLDFTDDEIKATKDARIFRLLHKAMKFDRIEAAKASAKQPAPSPARDPARVITPAGARPVSRAGNGSVQAAFAQFGKTRSIDDAARALQARNQAAAARR